ncbi:hypothetical protein [Streptomyces netropsis]|uniref:Uncharacterized protein n=1 Tax=Streptomyces netropsis TaxID=55404 RepID=A0A7W7LJM0_STRNE|nr:hypothetical protein [Streptomyces netropsis]MBB4890908.1 hypothetical protein [Streptomyces netropsis]
MSQYQTAGTNARLKLFALLAAQGVPASEADDLVAALEAGAVAGAQSEVVGLGGRAPASSGDVILCTREAGHYDPDDLPGWKRGKSFGTPGGWHLAGGSIWSDAGAACTPHTAA